MDELASQFGFRYETLKASIDEAALGDRTAEPSKLVRLLAQAKAEAIIGRHSLQDGYLITCDQVSGISKAAGLDSSSISSRLRVWLFY